MSPSNDCGCDGIPAPHAVPVVLNSIIPRGPVRAALAALDAHLQPPLRWVPYAVIRGSIRLRKGQTFVRSVLNSSLWKSALAERGLTVQAKGKNRHGVGFKVP